ncbi:MAG: chorismate mutase [Methylocystaceae bacterium]
MKVRGIRGATTVDYDRAEDILLATKELLQLIIEKNSIDIDDIAAAFFTVTPDLQSVYPAQAAREMGWTQIALLGGAEINVPEGVPRCIRVLLLVNTEQPANALSSVYLRQAIQLRDDLA